MENNGNDTGSYLVGKNKPPEHSKFGNRPQPDFKKRGKKLSENSHGRKRIEHLISHAKFFFGDDPGSEKMKAEFQKIFGEKAANLTGYEIATLRQLQKAIVKVDTTAYNSVMNQAFGNPNQPLKHSGIPASTIPVTHTTVIIENPHTNYGSGDKQPG